jgi:hypothetical protein
VGAVRSIPQRQQLGVSLAQIGRDVDSGPHLLPRCAKPLGERVVPPRHVPPGTSSCWRSRRSCSGRIPCCARSVVFYNPRRRPSLRQPDEDRLHCPGARRASRAPHVSPAGGVVGGLRSGAAPPSECPGPAGSGVQAPRTRGAERLSRAGGHLEHGQERRLLGQRGGESFLRHSADRGDHGGRLAHAGPPRATRSSPTSARRMTWKGGTRVGAAGVRWNMCARCSRGHAA